MSLKQHFYNVLLWLAIISSLPLILFAQKDKERARASCEGGILNSKVVVVVDPRYPDTAKQAKAEGNVSVRVRVDEEGKVYEVVDCCGHELLCQPSVDATYQTRFSPTMLSGKSVKVTGLLVYVFKVGEKNGRLLTDQRQRLTKIRPDANKVERH